MDYTTPDVPQGHGEVLTRPGFEAWAMLARSNAARAAAWRFDVAGVPVAELRVLARREAVEAALAFSARLGVPTDVPEHDPALLAMTGHQPELYHPGIWAKDFLLQRLAEETGSAAIDLVVDSDAFDAVEMQVPCMRPAVERCRAYLALGGPDVPFACAAVPSVSDVETFRRAGLEQLSTLPAPALGRHFGQFCDALVSAVADARDLAEAVTFARRRYEMSAGTTYLELPVTAQAASRAFATFFADVALRATEFAEEHNGELAAYRARNRVRGPARPFPDLLIEDDRVELPFWCLREHHRVGVWARPTAAGVEIAADGVVLGVLPPEPAAAIEAALALEGRLAPRALALTAFNRLFVADLFIHGVGGGRYDLVTDAVVRRFYGVEPPPFAVASMTMYLPLGAHAVTAEEVETAERRANRLEHNPDEFVDELRFDDPGELESARALAAEKASLVSDIARPDADKKRLGARIRAVNEELSSLLRPLAEEARGEIARLKAQREVSDIMTDRTYPFCLWSPQEVADKLR